MSVLRVALCGNPNVGKSTVFNALTGLKQHTGNWAGKTVESAMGIVRDKEHTWQLIDLPGAYSLFNGSPEEVAASDYLTFQPPDAVIVVCDATCLERNLNLALQIAQACPRTVLCVNMLDEARKRGIAIDLTSLEQLLSLPVVGVTARKKQGLDILKRRTLELAAASYSVKKALLHYPETLETALDEISLKISASCPRLREPSMGRFAAMRVLVSGEAFCKQLISVAQAPAQQELQDLIALHKHALQLIGYTRERLIAAFITASYQKANEICRQVVLKSQHSAKEAWQLKVDRLLSSKRLGIPLMLALLALILYITIIGANVPSSWLSEKFTALEPILESVLYRVSAPEWLVSLLITGVYRVTCWVISVMLPPMAIFFPLFTLLEDLGFLPRIAFNMDKCFQHCCACGKQALCMCMGLGCNAVGVTGCRIIQSPRERLIAILTNALIPCNGRFPTLIALITMFFVWQAGVWGSALGALVLAGLIVFSIVMSLLCSWLLSRTFLKGVPSAFALELPPFRRPKFGEVIVRSIFDRTLFVLGRAISVAAPAGLVVWLLANVQIAGVPLLRHLSIALDPIGRILGMDGVILLSFILGFPANEIVLPLMMMTYLNEGALAEVAGLASFRALLASNGWTLTTAVCTTLFALFHWPCSTTTLTVYKETKSVKWTLVAVLLPTIAGCTVCSLVAMLSRVFG